MLKIEAEGTTHWAEEKYREIFDKDAPRRVALVAEDNSTVWGFGVIQLLYKACEIENMVVAPEVRRRGLGKQLLAGLVELAREQGADRIFLEVRETNEAARALYNKFGFRQAGRRKSYYHNPEEDALRYTLHFQHEGLPGMVH